MGCVNLAVQGCFGMCQLGRQNAPALTELPWAVLTWPSVRAHPCGAALSCVNLAVRTRTRIRGSRGLSELSRSYAPAHTGCLGRPCAPSPTELPWAVSAWPSVRAGSYGAARGTVSTWPSARANLYKPALGCFNLAARERQLLRAALVCVNFAVLACRLIRGCANLAARARPLVRGCVELCQLGRPHAPAHTGLPWCIARIADHIY